MHRREFLRPKRLARTALQLYDNARELSSLVVEEEAPPPETSVLEMSRQAMATTFQVFLPLGTPDALEAANDVFDEIDHLEDHLTVYREHSELSVLNRTAHEQPVVVEDGLFHLLRLAEQIHRATEGAFDITTGALTKTWGFFGRQGRVPSDAELAEALQRTGMQNIVLNEHDHSIRFLRPGVEINLGSIGKGYALDRAAMVLRDERLIGNAVLHGGHSSVLALGNEPGSLRGWPIGIRHPWQRDQRIAIIRLKNRGLATSAATFQHLKYNGRTLGHILDPRTGWPAEGIASATAIAPTAAEADALATAFFILGVEKTRDFCSRHPQIGAVLLTEDPADKPRVFGLSAEDITICPRPGHSER